MGPRFVISFGLLVLSLGMASAQVVKPRILLVFDTSGSMSFDIVSGRETGGDNSREYPGDGGRSRLSVAKDVIRNIVETTSEVEFALMRYPQLEEDGFNNGFGREHLSGYTGLVQNPLNYMGFCDGAVHRQANIDRAYALLVPFALDNENDILAWMDGREDFPIDRELRAEGPTPLAESLRLAHEYYQGALVRDQAVRCRRNYVVLFTDGAESCVVDQPEEAVSERTRALRNIDVMGVPADVQTYVIAFAVDEQRGALLDEIARVGGTDDDGRAFRADDEAGLRAAFSQILAEAVPTEVCDGVDDDCDGIIDEGVLNTCGACGAPPAERCNGEDDDCDGLVDERMRNACGACGPVPDEMCNEVDDDCDGRVDERVQNACGGCAAVAVEVCNGRDDDCDGGVDNIPETADPLTRVCSQDVGRCQEGVERCLGGAWGPCDGVGPEDEACNGEDDDCDGVLDEVTRRCGPALNIGSVGQCRIGLQSCNYLRCVMEPEACDMDGWSLVCDGAVGPAEEVCDYIDNDCDGEADEGLFNECGACGMAPPETCNGVDDNCDGRIDEDARCPRGYLCFFGECVLPCAGGECPGALACVNAWPGQQVCHPDPCAGAQCPAGYLCDPNSRECLDPCVGRDCEADEVCELGECVNPACRHRICLEGERCFEEECDEDSCHGVQCEARQFCRDGVCFDGCFDQACGAGRRCVDGVCVGDPCGGRCVRGQRCDPSDGLCHRDPCADHPCPPGTACVVEETEDGEEAMCRGDAPCAHIQCPPGTQCHEGTCTDFTPDVPPDPDEGPIIGADGGRPFPVDLGPGTPPTTDGGVSMRDAGPGLEPDGGTPRGADVGPEARAVGGGDACACDASPRSPSLAFLWLMLGILAGRRRRR